MAKTKYFKVKKYNNFYEMLYNLNKTSKNKIAIKYQNKQKTYKELINDISSVYNFLKNNKFNNKNIGIISENRYEYIPIYLACSFDNVIAPIDKELTSSSLKELVIKFDIKVLFYTNKTKDLVNNLKGIKLFNIDEIELFNNGNINKFFNSVKNVDSNKFSVLAFTSGTTGGFKGAMLSQYNICTNLRAALQNNVLKSPTLALLPFNHTYGFNPGVLNTLYNGTTLCINTNLKHVKDDLKKYNPYFIALVPMVVEGLYNTIIREAKRLNKYDLFMKMIKISNILLKIKIDIRKLLFGKLLNKNLTLIVSGGGPLDPYYIERFEELGIKILNGYGLTECSPLIAVNREINNVIDSVGTIIYDEDVKISKEGEILVKGPNVMKGYYKDKKLTKETIVNGYFKTGDLGYIKDNNIYITGRLKNLIILENGKNFSPEEIENKLLKLSYVKECIVTSRKQSKNSIIVAKLYVEDTKNIDKDIKRINKELPNYMNIDKYEIMETEFEKTSTKKIIRSKYVG